MGLDQRQVIEAKARGMALSLPAEIEGRTFHSARLRANRAGKEGSSARIETSEVMLAGFQKVRIPVERGFSTIDIYYTDQDNSRTAQP